MLDIELDGLTYLPRFLTPGAEAEFLHQIDELPWTSELTRRTQQDGYRYVYGSRSLNSDDWLGPLPKWGDELAGRLSAEGWMEKPDQLIVNEYDNDRVAKDGKRRSQGILPHVDAAGFGPTIISISLGSAWKMTFINVENGTEKSLLLERGSLLVLAGAARLDWKHGIRPRKYEVIDGHRVLRRRRVSMTLRTVSHASRSVGP